MVKEMYMNSTIAKGQLPVSHIVRQDYRTADVFRKWGINYCCGGEHTLEQACEARGLDKALVEKDLEAARIDLRLPATVRFDQWPLDFLVDYLIHVHHAYVKQTLPALTASLTGFANGHKAKYPHLQAVAEVFLALCEELEEQVQKEECSIFPYIKQVYKAYIGRETYGSLFVKAMAGPLDRFPDREHKRLSALLMELREMTGQYSFDAGVCTNYQVVFNKLREFDADLVQHKHLENNILFPASLDMQKELLLF
jgi:regulator of cell morphogenesis and NO signaling